METVNDADGDGHLRRTRNSRLYSSVDACNYDPVATDPDDSCTYAEAYYDCTETASTTPTAMGFVIPSIRASA